MLILWEQMYNTHAFGVEEWKWIHPQETNEQYKK